jgi:STE24 endopeptidase
MERIIFIIIISIVCFEFLLERLLDYLNAKNGSLGIPEKLKNIYHSLGYKKSQLYRKANLKVSLLSSSLMFTILLIVLLLNGFALIDIQVSKITHNTYFATLLFFAIVGLVSEILSMPIDIYDTFVIEQRFGFNKTNWKTFISDKIKGWLLAIILGGAVLSLIIFLYSRFGQNFWWFAWVCVTLFSLFITFFYSSIIVPLFNKQTPLSEGTLKDNIMQFANKSGFKIDNIFVIDGSKRSSKANAYFTGFGSKKRIVLYDTLIDKLSEDELVAVLAHEIGHYKKGHVIKGIVSGIIQTGFMLFLFSLLVGSIELNKALGVDEVKIHIGMIAFGILYTPVSLFISIVGNHISRKNEYEADKFAVAFGLGNELISALKKLTVNNLSNLTPHPLYVFFHYSHPTLLQRIVNIEKQK